MARFAIYANPDGLGYLMDVQANLLSHLNTRVVVPLLPLSVAPKPAQTLNPVWDVDGVPCVLVTQFMAAVPSHVLKVRLQSADDRAHDVVAALDCLFQGV